jgi:hypothetical protein
MVAESRSEMAFDRGISVVCIVLGLLPVASLLAWSLDLGSFHLWFAFVSGPALVILAVIGWILGGRNPTSRIRVAIVAGTVGGLIGTIGYDLFRIPFAALGLRLFAPIESYGVLLLDKASSTPLTDAAGWAYHFGNGIGFGIAFAVVALGRPWWWALIWAMVLETATIVTPFASTYGIAGQWGLITIAYAAHIAYGAPLGVIVERGRALASWMDGLSQRATTWLLVLFTLGLVVWSRPFLIPAAVSEGQAAAPGPSAVIQEGRFLPEWIRTDKGECFSLKNRDSKEYRINIAEGDPVVPPGELTRVCITDPGVHRIRLTPAAYSGGLVIAEN